MDFNKNTDIFHVHTYRCGHTDLTSDEEYIEKAIELGAKNIWFSDHAPFPGDPFGSRMSFDELDEYICTFSGLKDKYKDLITIHTGLEIEYFPSFDKMGYYKDLRNDPGLDFLLLGQHMGEVENGQYTFDWDKTKLIEEEYLVLGSSIIEGIYSGYFDFVAHPDRIFRRRKTWDSGMEEMSKRIIEAAGSVGIPLEINMHSLKMKHMFWQEFWDLMPDSGKTILGLDAHSEDSLERRFKRQREYRK